jgi:hypothetical protein
MAQISSISNGEAISTVRTKLNNVITEINLLDPTDWVDYSNISTIVGWSSFTAKKIRYRIIGKQVFVEVQLSGTSNSTATSFTLPFSNSSIYIVAYAWCINNGVANNGSFDFQPLLSRCDLYYNFTNTWTASGTKQVYGQFFYEIA